MRQHRLSIGNIRNWLIFIVTPFIWPLAHLPRFMRLPLGKLLGYCIYFFPTRIKHITEVNLRLCFPHLTEKQREQLAKKNFASLGMGLIETSMAWLLPNKKLQPLCRFRGFEYAEKAYTKGRGIIFVTPHFLCIELAARFMGLQNNIEIVYRPHKKKYLSSIRDYFRHKHFDRYIPSDNMRQVIQALKRNKAICYAIDIDNGKTGSVFVPFFGISTATITSVSRLARLTQATIIPLAYYRLPNSLDYEIKLCPPLTNFPTEDLHADTAYLNTLMETIIREHPDQYVWQYKRFKTRPTRDEKRFYYSSHFPPRFKGASLGKNN